MTTYELEALGTVVQLDYGILVRLTLRKPDDSLLDLTNAETITMRFRLPDNTSVVRDAEVTFGGDSQVEYLTESGDGITAQVGTVYVQATVEFPDIPGEYTSRRAFITVEERYVEDTP